MGRKSKAQIEEEAQSVVNQGPLSVGDKVCLITKNVVGDARLEVLKVWTYPTTFRYLLDSGFVADHSEVRRLEA